MTHCATCGLDVEIECGRPLIATGFWLYDSTTNRDVPDLDSCDRFDCPHDTEPVHFSRMLHPMGSMGEDARSFYEDDGEPPF